VSVDQLELAKVLLRTLPAATAGSFLVALLILRSVLRRDAVARIAVAALLTALLAFVVPAIAVFLAAAASPMAASASFDFEESFGRKLPLLMAVSFAIALMLLRWRFSPGGLGQAHIRVSADLVICWRDPLHGHVVLRDGTKEVVCSGDHQRLRLAHVD
jgi:hypothetical protein